MELIDDNPRKADDGKRKYSRQKVTQFCASSAGTRLGGYRLEQIKDESRTRPIIHYKLHFDGRQPR